MKIAVFTPAYRASAASCAEMIQASIARAQKVGHKVTQLTHANCLPEMARNKALGFVLAAPELRSTEGVIFIDDDMKPEQDAICKLVELGKPIASSLLTTRIDPIQLLVKRWSPEKRQFLWRENFRTDQPSEGQYATGGAFMFVRRDVIEKVAEYHLSANDWLELRKEELDRMGVSPEIREQERWRKSDKRRANFAKDPQNIELFSRNMQDNELRTAEDIGFYWRVLMCGYNVTIDPRIRVTHTGEKDYSWEDYVPPSMRELLTA
jgi:hypothetical protein